MIHMMCLICDVIFRSIVMEYWNTTVLRSSLVVLIYVSCTGDWSSTVLEYC